MHSFSSLKNLHHRIAQGLCERGVLRADEGKIVLIFRRKIYRETNPQPERKLIERLRKAIVSESQRVDPRSGSFSRSRGYVYINRILGLARAAFAAFFLHGGLRFLGVGM